MGRRDAVQVILEVVAECRRLLPSLIVTWEPGWETRGNGSQANYDFGNVHHTASFTSAAKPFPTQNMLVTGRVGLSGPIANFGGPWCTVEAPRLHVTAAFPANHAGASRASGPVPALALYNPRTLGLEIDYAGVTPMTAGQMLVGHVWTKAVANVLAGGNVEHIRAHQETSVTGKWDIGYAEGKTYDMAAWRRESAAIENTRRFLPMLNDAEQAELLFRVRHIDEELTGPDWAEKGIVGWPMWAAGEDRSKPAPRRLSVVGMLGGIWSEQFGRLGTDGRPGKAVDTPYGQILSLRATADQILAQAKTAATREIAVDASKIDMSQVQMPTALSEADKDDIAQRVVALLKGPDGVLTLQ